MSYWENKKVLVTGASGFVGSNLTKRLISEGAYVVTFSPGGIKAPSLLVSEGLVEKIGKEEKGSVLEFAKLNRLVKKEKIQVIYHLAGQPLVEVGRESPIKTFDVNIRGTWNVLEVGRRNNVENFVVASTTHVYGDNPNLPYKEEYYPQPSGPYETSKACADLLSQSFADTYDLPVEIPRFTNIFGPGDYNFGRLVPKVIKSILDRKNVEVWDVGAVRDFLFIKDAIDAYLLLVEKKLPKEKRIRVMNFGSGKPIKIVELARKIVKLYGDKKLKFIIKRLPEERAKEIKKQYVSISKAEKELCWKPKYSLDDGLRETFEWYRKYKREILL